MATATESKYKFQVPIKELENPALIKNCRGKKKEELERLKEYLNGLKVKFTVEGEEIFVEGRALDD